MGMLRGWKTTITGLVVIAVLFYLLSLSLEIPDISSDPLPTAAETVPPTSTIRPTVVSHKITLGISFPPVEDSAELAFTLDQLGALGINHIRIADDWAMREPRRSNFNWTPLDERVIWAIQNDISVLLTIQSNGPDWACWTAYQNERSCVYSRPENFSVYIETLLSRYPNQFEKIQFGNEWLSGYWYPGSAEDFTYFNNVVYDAVQKISPDSQVVLGGFSTDQLRRLAYCDGLVEAFRTIDGELIGAEERSYCDSEEYRSYQQRFAYVIQNAKYDVIDLHLYDDVESWPAYFQAVTAYLPAGIPVIVSEFGGPNLFTELPYSDEYQAERLADYISTLKQIEVEEAYFFKLIQSDSAHPAHQESGLFREVDGEWVVKPAFYVFQEFAASQ